MNDEDFTAYLDKQTGAAAETPIQAFVTNLGKYNEGELVGEWLPLPTTKEQVQECFARIGLDGKRYEEFFITDYETPISGLREHLGEYSNLDELNYLATMLDELPSYQTPVFEAALELGDYTGSVKDIINLTGEDNLSSIEFLDGVHDNSDLGYYWIEESGCYDLESMGNLARYFDYEAFGRDIQIEQGGTFTSAGYVSSRYDRFDEFYDGMKVPEEYRVCAFPDKDTYKKLNEKAKKDSAQDKDAR